MHKVVVPLNLAQLLHQVVAEAALMAEAPLEALAVAVVFHTVVEVLVVLEQQVKAITEDRALLMVVLADHVLEAAVAVLVVSEVMP